MNETEQMDVYESAWADEPEGFEDDIITDEADQLAGDVDGASDVDEGTDTQQQDSEGPSEANEDSQGETGGAAETKPVDLTFVAKHLDEAREFDWAKDRDEIVANVQKGMDYDRVRQERDEIRAELPELREFKAFLDELAADSGVSAAQMIEDIRVNRLIKAESEAGRTITAGAAREQVRQATAQRAQQTTEEHKDKEPEVVQQDAMQKDIIAFTHAYPDVQATDIPPEVWEDVNRGLPLTTAYTRYENKQLKTQLEAAKHNEKIKDRSTGSRRSSGTSHKSAFDQAWDAADY